MVGKTLVFQVCRESARVMLAALVSSRFVNSRTLCQNCWRCRWLGVSVLYSAICILVVSEPGGCYFLVDENVLQFESYGKEKI